METNEIKKDSLGKDAAWAKWEKGYMDRTHKFKGTKHERALTPDDNKREMEAERGEFMYDKNKGQIRLRKTDDAENPIERERPARRYSKGVKIRKSPLNMVGIGVSRNSRCWEGYEPTPGVKPYAKGSCRKK